MTSNKIKNSSGVMWSAMERFAIQGSQFVVSLIVARLLIPADYGLIAMMSIFIAVATSLIDSGMAQALVQRQQRSEADLSTTLIFNIAVAIGLYAIIYLAAPYIAIFYDTPEICKVARIYSLILLINSFSVVQQALIAISLNFKQQAAASFTGVIIGGVVAIVMAYSGYGVWALVIQQLVSATIFNILLWALSSWRPRSSFSWESFRTLSAFGSKIMASGLMHVIYTNMYTIIIGKYFAPSELGLYNRSTTIAALPSSNISVVVERALYPILCEVQDSVEIASATLIRYLRMVCFAVFPTMVGIAIAAKPLTLVLLGEKWIDVVPLLQFVALAYMWDPIMKFYGSMIRSQGRSADFLRAEIIKKCCGVVILIVSIPFGVVAMCGGLLLYAFADMAIVIFFARRISPSLGYIETVRAVAPSIATTILMGGGVWYTLRFTSSLTPFTELIIAFFVGVTIYFGVAIATKRSELKQLVEIIKGLKK
ncbi:MAG: lipopolysaccharide biosynthesis protein [Rikenellaceae bacterium]